MLNNSQNMHKYCKVVLKHLCHANPSHYITSTKVNSAFHPSGVNWVLACFAGVKVGHIHLCLVAVTLCDRISHDNAYGAVIVPVHCHCESSPGSSDECSTQRQVAANLWTKPISLSQ